MAAGLKRCAKKLRKPVTEPGLFARDPQDLALLAVPKAKPGHGGFDLRQTLQPWARNTDTRFFIFRITVGMP